MGSGIDAWVSLHVGQSVWWRVHSWWHLCLGVWLLRTQAGAYKHSESPSGWFLVKVFIRSPLLNITEGFVFRHTTHTQTELQFPSQTVHENNLLTLWVLDSKTILRHASNLFNWYTLMTKRIERVLIWKKYPGNHNSRHVVSSQDIIFGQAPGGTVSTLGS